MTAVRRSNTKPELLVRQALHAAGLRYRVDYRLDLAGGRTRPDVVFTRRKVAIFVHGCFWHSCPQHATHPVDNAEFWATKLSRTVERDGQQVALLEDAGWTVLIVWEHEPPAEAVARILIALGR
jgi:DNA mismatch endonuclease (patch repair protein)